MERPKNCEEQYYDMMMQCWKKNPDDRPTFETLTWMLEDYFEDQRKYLESKDEGTPSTAMESKTIT